LRRASISSPDPYVSVGHAEFAPPREHHAIETTRAAISLWFARRPGLPGLTAPSAADLAILARLSCAVTRARVVRQDSVWQDSRVAFVSRKHEITPWGGTVSDLSLLADEARRLVAAAFEIDVSDVGISIMAESPGRTEVFKDFDEFEAEMAHGLHSVRMLDIVTFPPDELKAKANATVHFCVGRHGWVEVEGSDHVRVEGLAAALRDVAERRRRAGRWLRPAPFVLAGVALGLWIVGSVVFSFVSSKGVAGGIGSATITLLLLSAGLCVLANWAIPIVEFRLAGEATRLERVVLRPLKWTVLTALAAGLTALIGVLIATLVK
jgi:hypothetical protein